jgi:septal ring factor EnvC (AmiA/AmiB activator)
MARSQLVLAAVVPALAVGALLIGVVAWREHALAADERARDELAQRQLDEMRHLGDSLVAVKTESKQWQDKWLSDTRKLTDDLAKANQALVDSAEAQKKAEAAVAELAKQLNDLNTQLKQLQEQTAPKKP